MYKNIQISRGLILCAALGLSGIAGAAPADKSGYSWSNPVPPELLRELTTDRPDATESPFTVDTGHMQLEMDFANFSRDREGGGKVTEWEAVPFNLRFGLRENFEAGIFVTPYHRTVETSPAGVRTTEEGFGDIGLRVKWNGGGNDGGDFAWGLMADLKVPTAAAGLGNDHWEGALTLPLAFELGGGWGGGAMTSIGLAYNDADRRRAVWVNTFTVGRDLAENMGGFLEIASETGLGRHVATFNSGLTFSLNANTQFDCGVNLGVSRSAPDIACFTGISRRF